MSAQLESVAATDRVTGEASLATAAFAIYTTSLDTFGGLTQSWTDQKYGKNIGGQAKMTESTTKSSSTSVDGTTSDTSAYKTVYTYYDKDTAPKGKLGWLIKAEVFAVDAVPALPSSVSKGNLSYQVYTKSTDAFGNVTESWSHQEYVIVGGQAKLKSVTTLSQSTSVDSSVTVTQPYEMRYTYVGETELSFENSADQMRAWAKAHPDVAGRLDTVKVYASPDAVAFFMDTPSKSSSYEIYSVTTDVFGSVTESWSHRSTR